MEVLNIPKEYIDFINDVIPRNYDLNLYGIGNPDGDIVEKLSKLYRDCEKFGIFSSFVKSLIYLELKYWYRNLKEVNLPDLNDLIDVILKNDEVKKKILSENAESEFFRVLKDLIPLSLKLDDNINKNKKYAVLKNYHDILDFLSKEGLANYSDKDLEQECLKRYPASYGAKAYLVRMKNKKYKEDKSFDITSYPVKWNFSIPCSLFSRYFYQKMLKFYEDTNYMYRPVNDYLDFYQFDKLGFLTYHFDDLISISLSDLGVSYPWTRYEFWALLYIEYGSLKYNVDVSSIKNNLNFTGTILVTPTSAMDEAFLKYFMHEGNYKIDDVYLEYFLEKIGLDISMDETLLTDDYEVFYHNPKLVDNLVIKDCSNFKTLEALKSKTEEERLKYIKSLISAYKRNAKKLEILSLATTKNGKNKGEKGWSAP